MLKAYGKFWKNYVNFTGRTTRKDFWFAILLHVLIILATFLPVLLSVFGGVTNPADSFGFGLLGKVLLWLILPIIYTFATFIPTIALAVRRLTDLGWQWGVSLTIYLSYTVVIQLLKHVDSVIISLLSSALSITLVVFWALPTDTFVKHEQ
ncbi:hypothetical protein Hs30E_19010 [Lactococcus hodotermopsidis]|uniref:DUF805 domain-containing protein n=1 Tax=Pseudolactococcus hodotermopsidis TaxID=2709157 RepID=A0A6A0BD42_9LACT|nr:DUF805 domain-containing protein [Lactococcus hodotermopsidis]GFH43350.1 hypothetical protein Hs30E_19010 [Lactococcus hodotermopsidis]